MNWPLPYLESKGSHNSSSILCQFSLRGTDLTPTTIKSRPASSSFWGEIAAWACVARRCVLYGVIREGGRSFEPCQSPKHRIYVFSLLKWRGAFHLRGAALFWRITRSLTTGLGPLTWFAVYDFAAPRVSYLFVWPSAAKPIAPDRVIRPR